MTFRLTVAEFVFIPTILFVHLMDRMAVKMIALVIEAHPFVREPVRKTVFTSS